MADITCSPPQQCVVVQTTKEPPNWIEVVHGVESVATIIGLVVAGWWAYRSDWIKTKSEGTKERDLRERERKLREDQLAEQQRSREWEQTKIAREINEKFLDDSEVQQVLTLVDCDGDEVTLTDDSEKDAVKKYKYNLKVKEDVRAMRSTESDPVVDEKEVFLRDCFDAWFYWMALIEQYLQNGLILPKDIAFPSNYYTRQLRGDADLYAACRNYVKEYRLSDKVIEFMDRFERADAAKPHPASA